MRVTRLEIFGFKSFLERFVLDFNKDLIGIVGPNGCGKSNVVDALRWILGETHAKQLRGGSFEDLIFNGSDTRRPLGMAEVSLTIQPESDWQTKAKDRAEGKVSQDPNLEQEELDTSETEVSIDESELVLEPLADEVVSVLPERIHEIPGIFDAAEIQFTRRLFRSGESEYYINKVPCRLKDMQELFRLIGLGARGLSIVQQGQIGQFISKKPHERRELLEDAAGISGFRTKIEATERRLEKTSDNLNRLNDLVIEIEKQVRSLKKQAERARSRNQLKSELYDAEKELFTVKAGKLVCSISDALNSKLEIEDLVAGCETEISEHEARLNESEGELLSFDSDLFALRTKKDDLSRVILENEASLNAARRRVLDEEARVENLSEQKVNLSERIDVIDLEFTKLEREKVDISDSRDDLSTQIESLRSELVSIQANNQQKLEEFLNSENTQDGSDDGNNIQSEILSISSQIEEKDLLIKSASGLHDELKSNSRDLKDKETNRNSIERNLNSIGSEIKAIKSQLDGLSAHALKEVGVEAGDSVEIEGAVLLSLLSVKPEMERVVHAVLGDRANYLVSKDASKFLKNYLSGNSTSKKMLGMFEAKESGLTVKQELDQNIQMELSNFGSPILDYVSLPSEYEGLSKKLFSNIWVAKSKDSAIQLRDKLATTDLQDFLVVLSSGEVLTSWGWYTTVGEGLHLSFARRIKELESEQSVILASLDEAEAGVREAELALEKGREKIEEINMERQVSANLQKQLSSLLVKQSEEQRARVEELRNRERVLRQEFSRIEKEKESKIQSLERDYVLANARTESITRTAERLTSEKVSYSEKIESILESVAEAQAKVEILLQEEVDLVSKVQLSSDSLSMREQIGALENDIRGIEDSRYQIQGGLNEIKQSITQIRDRKSRLEVEHRAVVQKEDRAKIELDMLLEDIARTYPEDQTFLVPEESEYRSSLEDGKPVQVTSELQDKASSLRKRLEREGEVDPQSIEMYETEKERLETLIAQRTDLLNAKITMERTIRQLKELSKDRFVSTFNSVKETFKDLIPRLFAGGSGHLELVNPEDPLTSGVEVVVRPPGKKISTMELLSGGEKALVATAILVSMFLHHPGPICVLDEVDAPLDDANLGRFLEVVKEISSRTQFLIITHNKITMQAVDRIIGITMQERGVTTALSVDLEEAEATLKKKVVNS